MDSHNSVERRASDWLTRRETSHWTGADESALNAWLEESTANRVAYLRLKAGWDAMDRLKALGAGFARGSVPTPEQIEPHMASGRQRPRERQAQIHPLTPSQGKEARRRGVWFALAAGVLIFSAAGYVGWDRLRGPHYSTPVGVTAAVPLPDGSKITLNTNSEIRLAVNERQREVELQRGEAYFEVTPDPARPFTVRAGDKRIVVLGTKFSVKWDRDDIRVVVTEGKVRLEGPNFPARRPVLMAGDVAETHDEKFTVQQRELSKVEQLLTWRSGYLVFEETTLADAAAEFNRYSERKIRIDDPAVAGIRISGKFRSANFESFVLLLQESHQISAQRSGNAIVLTAEAIPPK